MSLGDRAQAAGPGHQDRVALRAENQGPSTQELGPPGDDVDDLTEEIVDHERVGAVVQ